MVTRGKQSLADVNPVPKTKTPSEHKVSQPAGPASESKHTELTANTLNQRQETDPVPTALIATARPRDMQQTYSSTEAAHADLAAWNEVERAINSDPSKLPPQMQHYLREQVMAVLASQKAAAAPATFPAADQTAAALPQKSNLPGPDSDAAAPIIDEAAYRRAKRLAVEQADAEPLRRNSKDVQQANYVSPESKNSPRIEKETKSPDERKATADESTAMNEAAGDKRPELDWRNSLEQTLHLLEAKVNDLPDKDRDAQVLAAYLRLLHAIDNNREQAVRAIEQLPAEEQEYWKHQMHALLLAMDAEGKHASSRRAALVLRELRAAVDRLANVSTLDVGNLALCKSVESYGCFTEFASQAFRPGDEVVLYAEIDNFTAEKVQDKYETELQWTYDILDSGKNRVANVALPLDKTRCENRRRDYFIAQSIFLPKDLRAGSYTLRLSVEDIKGGKSSEASLEFRIR